MPPKSLRIAIMSYQKIDKIKAPNASRETHLDAGLALSKRSPETDLAKLYPKPPVLKHGNDKARAKQLNKLIKDAESGLVRILKVGFFLECLADDLPHGMLGPWVEVHCNREWRTVQRWKQVAAGVGDVLGISLKQRLEYKLHEVLSLPMSKVPEGLKSVREKIDAEIKGKSYRQLFLELKQVDEANPTKPKLGRLKGQGGASKEQRANAAELEAQELINEKKLKAVEIAEWLTENSDEAGLGAIRGTPEANQLYEATGIYRGFMKHGAP